MRYLNKSHLLLATSLSTFLLAPAAFASEFNIPGGSLNDALDAYGKQAGVQLIYSDAAVKGIQSRGVSGNLGPDEALTRLLSNTGFTVRRNAGTLVISRQNNSGLEISPLQLAQASPATGRIEEVLVTARKREEAIENIPISITALNAEDLKQFGVRNFADLEGVVPGLNLGGGGNGVKRDSSPFIRGVGQRETKVTLDSAVATYIDGVYIGRAAGAMLDVVDVDNIQVLRGPQGTLFGRNATGGALAVTLKKPNNTWEANISANIGNYGRRDISGTINVPFIEDLLMGRLTISSANSNGYFTNLVDNTKWGGDNRITGIAQLRFLPTDRITIDVLGERTRIRETPRPQRCAYLRPSGYTNTVLNLLNGGVNGRVDGLNRYEGLCKRSEALPPSQFASDAAIGNAMPRGRYWVDTSTAAVTANWDVGNLGFLSDVSAKSISAWRKTLQIADEDLDAVDGTFLIRIQPYFDETIQYSQELQLSAKTFNDRLFLSTGVYYFKERTPQNDLNLSAGISYTSVVAPNTNFPNGGYANWVAEAARERLQTDNRSFAWYGQADFDITQQIQLTAGVRWTVEERWSRYSKAYVAPESAFEGSRVGTSSSGLTSISHLYPDPLPVLGWEYCGVEFKLFPLVDGLGVLQRHCTPGLLIGDELSTTDSAWTPMVSLKYKASDRILQKFHLDQAMVYATYSQGFHSGGVTAGAVDLQFNPPFITTYRPGPGDVPCPPLANGNPAVACALWDREPDPGYTTADPITFEPEKVTNYEIGIKMAGLDRRVQANLTAFYMSYTNMQTTSVANRVGIPVPYIENVGKSVIKGFEAEVTAMPAPQWRIVLNGSYTDADIKEWMSKQVGINLDGSESTTAPDYYLDRSDERMPRVPRWQFFASTDYSFRLPGGGAITPSVAVRFTSSIYHGFDRGSWVFANGGYYYNHGGDRPPTRLSSDSLCAQEFFAASCTWSGASSNPQADPMITAAPGAKWKTTSRPTAFLDARLSWISDDAKMEAALWGKNLTNKDDYLVGGIPLADVTGAVGQVYANPRTFGLTFTYHFGE